LGSKPARHAFRLADIDTLYDMAGTLTPGIRERGGTAGGRREGRRRSAESVLESELPRRLRRLVPRRDHPLAVVGVDRLDPTSAGSLLGGEARDVAPSPVHVEAVARRIGLDDPDGSMHRERLESPLGLADERLRPRPLPHGLPQPRLLQPGLACSAVRARARPLDAP